MAISRPRRLLSRRPVIYSGVFGRGLFQTLYEPSSSLAAFLPLTFEWNVVAIVLALAGIIGGGWMWLMVAPLLMTWVICVNGALKAPIDKRFRGIKARALVALLIYLGPILRGYERIKWRLKETRAPETTGGLGQPIQKPRLALRERAFYLSYWSETGDDKEALLGGLMRFLIPQKYFVVADQGWDAWDLKIARGLWSRALVLVCTENHGEGKRLLRVRCAMRLSRFAAFVLRAYAVATAVALILDAPALGAVVGSSASRMAGSSRSGPSSSAGSCTASSRPWPSATISCRCCLRVRAPQRAPAPSAVITRAMGYLARKLLPYLWPYRLRFAWALRRSSSSPASTC